jgi:drug/metabolite transporter (DMT)-like permease
MATVKGTMSRLQADLVLLLVALIWGTTFIAQKDASGHIGNLTFVAVRFAVSAILVLPFAVREFKKQSLRVQLLTGRSEIILICVAFCSGVILQQIGVKITTVTNAGFLTGLYVLFVPVICAIIYKQKISVWIWPAAFMSVAGVWFLSGGKLDRLSFGDVLIILCAIAFALQVTLAGRIMSRIKAPITLSCLQYACVSLAAFIGAYLFEHPSFQDIQTSLIPILYAGFLSGGIAYTLQIIAQQYTPASDAAVIMSGEALFAALSGAWLLNERLLLPQYFGCALIAVAILLVEFAPFVFKSKTAK